ncbi:head GIN domain-containing protein [Allosphingosinicella humi]
MRSILFASVLALGACNVSADAQNNAEASATPVKRSFQVASFESVSLGGPHNVVVQVGPAASVRAEGPAAELDRLKIEVRGGALEIGTRKDKSWTVHVGRTAPVTIYVTTPTLKAAAIGGSGDMRIDKVEGAKFSAAVGGSGDIAIESLKVGEASFSIAGSGGIKAAGTAGKATISVVGSGDVDVAGVESRSASVSIAGSGDVQTRAMETADVSIMGSGDVTVSGPAKCSVNKMGSGDVRCGG